MAEVWTEHPAPNIYFDSTFSLEAAKIQPGEYYATGRDMLLVTVLGSCVAACIRDHKSGIGGMNHFMLPDGGEGALGKSARYGIYAMEVLVNHLIKLGAQRDRLVAKVFGGGAVLPGFETMNIGERNAEFVLKYLDTERITVQAKDLKGDSARKIYFFPQSGRVLVKNLRNLHNDTILARESTYRTRLQRANLAGDVEMFK
jgi:chemotaxis protein CheD